MKCQGATSGTRLGDIGKNTYHVRL